MDTVGDEDKPVRSLPNKRFEISVVLISPFCSLWVVFAFNVTLNVPKMVQYESFTRESSVCDKAPVIVYLCQIRKNVYSGSQMSSLALNENFLDYRVR